MEFKIKLENVCFESKAMAESFICVNCQYLKFNQYLLECGHYLCDKCLKTIKECPVHNIKIIQQSLFKAKIMDEILKIKIKCFCFHRIEGCEWIGLLKELCEKHIYNCIFKQEEIFINSRILGKKYLNKEPEVIDLNVIEVTDDDHQKINKNSKHKKKNRKNTDSDYFEEVINLDDTPPRIINLIDD